MPLHCRYALCRVQWSLVLNNYRLSHHGDRRLGTVVEGVGSEEYEEGEEQEEGWIEVKSIMVKNGGSAWESNPPKTLHQVSQSL